MNTRIKLNSFFVGMLILLSVAACMGGTATQINPSATHTSQQSTFTLSATPSIPTTTPTQQLEILYQDDFSDPASGWESYRSADGKLDYEDGKYRMQIPVSNNTYWVAANIDYADVILEADAVRNGGPLDNVYGLMCRLSYDTNEAYMFLITSKGYYGIAKWTNLKLELLGNTDYGFSDAIFTDERENHLRAECIGNQLSLSVNGQRLLEVSDNTLVKGDVGFAAGTTGESGTDILFDNLVVYAPQ